MPSHNRHNNENQERSSLSNPYCHLQKVVVDAKLICLDEVEFADMHAFAGADCTRLLH